MSYLERMLSGCESFVESTLSGYSQRDPSPDAKVNVFHKSMWALVLLTAVYGAAMGAYGAAVGQRSWLEQLPQMLYSAIKAPLLIFVTTSLALPSFFVFNTILGLKDDLRVSVSAISSSLNAFALMQFCLLPLILFFYFSIPQGKSSYRLAVLANAAIFGFSSIVSQIVLLRRYRWLIHRDRNHQRALLAWCVVFVFVGVQLGWTLRPFIGNPTTPTTFFREHAISNAYIAVWRIVRSVLV